MIPFSILDLCPIVEGSTAAQALSNSLDLAQHAEAWGYHRYWLAEHHNIVGIGSAATAVVIGHVAAGTSRIRVGAGGIMLPNHPPLVIAEQFGTLESLFPGRIDLGLGRAPGTDRVTLQALRRDLNADRFPEDVLELQSYFRKAQPSQAVRAVPGAGLQVPIWLLGSSTYSAQLAARLGVPFAFAAHFAPGALLTALKLYRDSYQPSAEHPTPYVMVSVSVVASDTDNEAFHLATSHQQQFLALQEGRHVQLPPPTEELRAGVETKGSFIERTLRQARTLAHMRAFQTGQGQLFGSRDTVRRDIEALVANTKIDELMVTSLIYDHDARLRSYEILAEIGASAAV